MKTINLFCLPFAGGNKYSYRQYELKAPSFLKILPVEYPGRGSRINEPLMGITDALVNDLYVQIKPKINGSNYAIYGHSMGGLLAYLLAKKIIDNHDNPPLHLFITGTSGPSALSRNQKKRHLLGKKEFLDEIKNFGGAQEEVLQNEELLNYFEPILRADFKAVESYTYTECHPLTIPFTVITGSEEEMTLADISLWQKETTHAVDFKRLPGKHFFILKYPHEIIEIISKKLLASIKDTSYGG